MKAYIAFCPIGIFACDENSRLIDKEIFERNSEHVAAKFSQLKEGKEIPELKLLYHRVKQKADLISIEGEKNFGMDAIVEFPNLCGIFLRKNLSDLGVEFGFNPVEHFVHNLSLDIAEEKLSSELKKPDKIIVQVVNAINELTESANVSSERFGEWALLNLAEQNKPALSQFKTSVSEIKTAQKNLENYLAKLMKENFPNITAVAGASIGAKLIASAGDAERLAKMASSKIQVLGAEKALFRHLTTGAKPPKYGLIVQHNLLASAPQFYRGKVARALAASVSIAVKADVYSKKFMGDKLRKDLEARARRIRGNK